jgi:hypothetical protein
MFGKKKAIDSAQFQQFLEFQAAMKEVSEKKKKAGKEQSKPGAKRKKRSKLRLVILFLVISASGLAAAFHYFPVFFIELIESAL